ncbi:hypothetical protein GAO09_27710 [Rhizobiales bacterium RZME27]|jgi:hypothetical protein|uniref:DUF5330 domain-containing protein n=1 Tax=Endobacterium cereale TaxID=2663029 RepID=A0A6A8AGB2_9HYPH|nr:DUF5330 domain-containing protein [Endobacterium cereale]MEB2842924.1 DUF5330 domain-containing protein [Endobacterium cereale]MQY49819.1 hypothetical protein [Endobacterium cereale]
MWFLIKGSVYFGLGLVALSYFSAHSDEANGPKPFEMANAIAAATGAYDYVSSICIEKPDVCMKGAETVTALGYRAKEGARVAYELLDKSLAEDEAKTVEAIISNPSQQPMPQKIAAATNAQPADNVFTGTVINIPVPMKRPQL